ncbi:hypothetical protein BU26DRAFT_549935 [Trematosphaeria pertusa]|uniref:Uncharacterized protein n=1 Tax=Trematosphaeria pertusa TaxID=390896 RepID=A0A6A6IMM0_9PLEO|nr:uncharacterized protein BU26DRAFT_549935 [Trematosphaeria pertusa]KAF2251469.1 hypothetical protein BU26DRAFT_549935 [Trematosphaeria pertusa]
MPLPHIEEMGVEHPLPHHALSSPTTPGPRRLVHTNIYLASIASGRLSNSPWLLLFVFPIRWSLATSRPAWCTRWTRSGELLSRSTLANRSVLCLWGFVESLIASGYEIYELSVSNHNTLWAILDTNPQSRPLQGVRLAAGGVGAPLAGAMPPRGTREIDSATIPEWARELSDTQYAISVRHLRFDDDFELEDDSDRDLINQVLDRSGPNILPDRGQDPHRCPAMCDTVPMPGYRHCHFHLHYACKQVQHPTKSKWMEQLSWLRKFAREVPDNLWVVDVEYSMFNFACPVAWDITFRRFSDRRVILHSRINYAGATVDELIGLYYSVCPPGFRLAAQTESRIRASFKRLYPAGFAAGLTFKQIRARLLEQGFDPLTHCLLAYGISLDLQVVWKVLAGIDEPFCAPYGKEDFQMGEIAYTCLQPVNAHYLARNMLHCKRYRLTDVYRTLFGLEDQDPHFSYSATLLFLDIIYIFVAF